MTNILRPKILQNPIYSRDQKDLKREKGFFGDDMVAVYEIKEKKHLTGDELNKLNEQIQDYFKKSIKKYKEEEENERRNNTR